MARAQILWMTILAPTLGRLHDGLQVTADGVMVRMQYYHRPYRTAGELRASIHEPGTSEEACFYVLASDLDAVARGALTLGALLERSKTTIDGVAIGVGPPGQDQALTPGPE